MLAEICGKLRKAQAVLAAHTAAQRNAALGWVAREIQQRSPGILAANRRDLEAAQKAGTSEALLDRLALSPQRLEGVANSLDTVIRLPDPLGQLVAGWKTPQGLRIRQVRVPIGVAAIIYESRPAVAADSFALAYKSGNALLLRGSSSALESNKAFMEAIHAGLCAAGQDAVPGAAAMLQTGDRAEVDAILAARGLIDVVIPRGGAALIKRVVETSRVPVIETGTGVCHLYVDESGDMGMAVNIAENGKLQRPGVCNALECLVVHRAVLPRFLPAVAARFAGRCEMRCDAESFAVLSGAAHPGASLRVVPAAESDFGFEFLDTILAIKTVGSIGEAIGYINTHNTQHSETIVTGNLENARRFQEEIDAACVYVNASTRFTDGGEFGFGVELGISTQKLHVRGPMGLCALTTGKYLIDGEGHIR
ncbi:MAG: glutamate-5-semialdehyde dehydrogenase [Spirochaetaceae bacterium]|jgi:glutamate-5-semialdehyde dehydrogenase|nr:glutamate-5-semialdehyde dehydrogenase [Spirochaetaceae bacterium]